MCIKHSDDKGSEIRLSSQEKRSRKVPMSCIYVCMYVYIYVLSCFVYFYLFIKFFAAVSETSIERAINFSQKMCVKNAGYAIPF